MFHENWVFPTLFLHLYHYQNSYVISTINFRQKKLSSWPLTNIIRTHLLSIYVIKAQESDQWYTTVKRIAFLFTSGLYLYNLGKIPVKRTQSSLMYGLPPREHLHVACSAAYYAKSFLIMIYTIKLCRHVLKKSLVKICRLPNSAEFSQVPKNKLSLSRKITDTHSVQCHH